MSKFYIKDVNGKVLFEVDTLKYPNAKPHNCKIKDPGGNIVTSYKNHYYVAVRHRDGSIKEPLAWLAITHEYYDAFVLCGSTVIPPTEDIINYVDKEVSTNG